MKLGACLWFDVSYTRTQRGNIGITRTVRRLFQEMRTLAQASGTGCEPVAFHSGGFRRVPDPQAPSPRASGSNPQGIGQRVFQVLSGPSARRPITWAMRVWPSGLLRWLWSVSSTWTFDALSREHPKAAFQPGDILFIADASWKYPAWRAARLARQQGAKVVLLVYDLMPIRHPEFCFALVPLLFRNWLGRMIACSDAIVCISRATACDLDSWMGEAGIGRLHAPPPIAHFRLGCDPRAQVHEEPREALARFLAAPGVCFGAVGSVEPKKNYGFLLDVFEGIWSRGLDYRLVIAGRPTAECGELLRRMRRHPEQGRRLLTLFDASDADVAEVYASSRALIFPSLMEGFGLPLVEARTQGCPVIASDLPVFLELADQGVSFFDRDSQTALTELILEQAAQDKRPAVGPQAAFLWRDSARQCRAAMDRLLCHGAAPR